MQRQLSSKLQGHVGGEGRQGPVQVSRTGHTQLQALSSKLQGHVGV
jgi:hypothetical protein